MTANTYVSATNSSTKQTQFRAVIAWPVRWPGFRKK